MNNNNFGGTNGFPTWWCNTDATATTGDTLTFTASTDDDSSGFYSGNILSLTTNTTWDYHNNNYDLWPKGVQDPTTEFKYTPKWHILLGYKSQIQVMWD